MWCLRNGSKSLGFDDDLLPVFLPLRHLPDLKSGLDAFIQQELDSPHLKVNSGFGRHLLERGRLLFLLDGLDEVADVVARKEVSAWIQAAAKVRPDCTFVLTSALRDIRMTVA